MENNKKEDSLEWRVHPSRLFEEIITGTPGGAILKNPLTILWEILRKVGKRASELNDPELNALMCRLSVYAIANPDEQDYNPELTEEIIEIAKALKGKE